MKKKTFIVQLLDSKKPSRMSFTQVEDANFYSNDTDASLVFIPHEDTFDFQTAKVVMYNRGDESLVERDMEVTTEDGRKVASYELPDEIIAHWGDWTAQPVFISGGETYSGAIVPFSVIRYLMHERPATLTEIVTVTEFIQQSQALVNDVVQKEAQRVTQEQTRQSAETIRVQAESERSGKYESYAQQFNDVITDLSEEKDYHSLPEISGARGGHDTLGQRLGETTAQLAQTAKRTEMLSNDNDLSGRIDNLLLNNGTDSSAEVQDARQSLDGTNYDLLSQRLIADFNRTARTKVSTLEPFDSKDGDLWFKPKQSSLYEGIRMNGTSTYIDMSEHVDVINAKIAETNRATLEVVVTVSDKMAISWVGGGQTLNAGGRYIYGIRSGEERIMGYTSAGQVFYSPMAPNEKIYLSLVFDGSKVVLYENGIEKSTVPSPNGTITPFVSFVFGRDNYLDGQRYLNGTIFDIRLWNKGKTKNEIRNELGVELSGAEEGLVGYWNLNEKNGNVATDKTLNGLDGTIYNGEWVTSID